MSNIIFIGVGVAVVLLILIVALVVKGGKKEIEPSGVGAWQANHNLNLHAKDEHRELHPDTEEAQDYGLRK